MTALEALAWGYGLIEGPCCDQQGNLYFSDVPNGGVYRLAPDGSVETAIPKRRGVGGIALHADGGLVVSGRNICHVKDGATRIVFAPEALGLNDLTVDAAGRVICGTLRTDPFGQNANRTPGECWRIDATDRGHRDLRRRVADQRHRLLARRFGPLSLRHRRQRGVGSRLLQRWPGERAALFGAAR